MESRGIDPKGRVALIKNYVKLEARIERLSNREEDRVLGNLRTSHAINAAVAERRRLHAALFAGAGELEELPPPPTLAQTRERKACTAWTDFVEGFDGRGRNFSQKVRVVTPSTPDVFQTRHLEWRRERRRAQRVDTLFAEKIRMRIIFVSAVVLLSALATPAAAKGCLKGAVVGGVVGHYARHHGVIGAAVGCLIGRHQAKKRARAQQHTLLQHDRAGQSEKV
jgi:hypothetical protein